MIPLKIDVSQIKSKSSLHELLYEKIKFPDYYGMNWDAFWDCIRDSEQSSVPCEIEIIGMRYLRNSIPKDAQIFDQTLGEYLKIRQDIHIKYVDL